MSAPVAASVDSTTTSQVAEKLVACSICGVNKPKSDFTATQFKRASRACKACSPAGAQIAEASAAAAAAERAAAEASRMRFLASAAQCEVQRLKKRVNADFSGHEQLRFDTDVDVRGGKDLRARAVRAGRKSREADF